MPGMKQPFESAISVFAPSLPLGVALSGGADSTALLLACARRWPGQVRALHVHHGLQAAADGFEQHCVTMCRQLDVPLHVQRLDARPAAGQSPEDAARQARYAALQAMAYANGLAPRIASIALGQHADDQAETLLLALSRGAGVAGLAAMPERWERAGLSWHRPLLQVSARDVRRWLSEQGVAWVEDPTNSDTRFARNRIRADLLPVIEAAFPAFRQTFARTAANAWDATQLLREIAQGDLAQVGVPPALQQLQPLSRARQANVLRHWLREHHHTTPSAAQLGELLDQIAACITRSHRINLKVGRGFVVRSGSHLDWHGHRDVAP